MPATIAGHHPLAVPPRATVCVYPFNGINGWDVNFDSKAYICRDNYGGSTSCGCFTISADRTLHSHLTYGCFTIKIDIPDTDPVKGEYDYYDSKDATGRAGWDS